MKIYEIKLLIKEKDKIIKYLNELIEFKKWNCKFTYVGLISNHIKRRYKIQLKEYLKTI